MCLSTTDALGVAMSSYRYEGRLKAAPCVASRTLLDIKSIESRSQIPDPEKMFDFELGVPLLMVDTSGCDMEECESEESVKVRKTLAFYYDVKFPLSNSDSYLFYSHFALLGWQAAKMRARRKSLVNSYDHSSTQGFHPKKLP